MKKEILEILKAAEYPIKRKHLLPMLHFKMGDMIITDRAMRKEIELMGFI